MDGTSSFARVEEVCRWVSTRLEDDHLGRRDLSEMESALLSIRDEVARIIQVAETSPDRCPDLALARTALLAMNESLDWLNVYRRYASLAERREKLDYTRWSALGAVAHVKPAT